MEPVKLGVIGCGVIGAGAHLPDATRSPLFDVVAVADLIEERAAGAAAKFGVPNVYLSGSQLLRDNRVEAVVLAMPTGVRTPVALEALAAGKHALIEKPIAMDAAQVRQMIAARGNLTVGCCSCRYLTLPSAKAAMDCVASGALGALRVVRARAVLGARRAPTHEPPPWRVSKTLNGGGILVNWGCYDLDYMMGITGYQLRPKVVLAQTWPIADHLSSRVAPGSDAECHFIALIRCEGDAVISFERAESAAIADDEAWQIIGTRGSLRMRMLTGKGKQVVLDEALPDEGVVSQVIWEGDEDGGDLTLGVLEDFATAIREHRQPMTSLERALVMQQITDAIYASAETGRAVEIG